MTEAETREGLRFAIRNTCLGLPFWETAVPSFAWDESDKSLSMTTDEGDFRFHLDTRGRSKMTFAVLSWEDPDGTATWEGRVPREVLETITPAGRAALKEAEG